MFPSALGLMAGALFLATAVLSDCGGPASSSAMHSSTLVTSYVTPSNVSSESSYTSGATLVVESMSVVTVYASSQLAGYKKRGASPSYVPRQDSATTLIKTMTVIPLPLSGNSLYTVTSGDYLYAIATAHKIPLNSLTALNPTINPTLITPGQVINVRATGSLSAEIPSHTGGSLDRSASNVQRQASCPAALATKPCPPMYTVVPGDTFYSIATCCGMTYKALEAMNTYSELGLPVGATVTISGAAHASVPPNAASAPAGKGLHTVVSADNLYDIASANSISLASLSALNPNLKTIITPGQVLTVRTPGPLQTTPPVPPQRRQGPAGNGVHTTQPNPTPGSNGAYSTYTVVSGDNFDGIAVTNSIPVSSFIAANPVITNPALVSVGHLPSPGLGARAQDGSNAVIVARDDGCPTQNSSTTTPASQPQMSMPCNPPSYTVMLGDTLNAIAHACSISLDALTSANNGLVATALQVGATLSIPSGGTVEAQVQTKAAAVALVQSAEPSSAPSSSLLSSNPSAASTPMVSGNQYPNAVTPPAGYPNGDFYTSGGNKVRASQSSSQLGSSPCADNTALNCIVIGPGTTHTPVPSSSATPLLSEVPCGPGGEMACIVFNGQTLTLNKTSNTFQSMTSALASSPSSVSWINSTTTSNGITSSSTSTLLTQASSTTSKIATSSRSSAANNLKIPMWPLLLYFIGVTLAISSSSQATSSLTVSSTSSSVVVSSIPTTLMTTTTSQTTALNSTATSSNNAWMWSILYDLAKISPTTKSSSAPLTTTQSSSSTGPLSISIPANRTVLASNSTSKPQNSTIAPSITKRSASELQPSLITSWASPTPCPDNTLALCEVVPARTFTRLRSTGSYSAHSYPRPTASPCPDQVSMGCIGMEHNTLSFVWSINAGSEAKTQSPTSSSASMTKRSIHELVTSTIPSLPSPTLYTDNKSYYCYTFGTQTVSSMTALYNDTTFSYPLPTASPCPDESSKGCLSLGHKTLSFLWLHNATSLAPGPGLAASANKRQPPLTFSASAFPQPRPCPDNTSWECVDFGTSTYSFNPKSLPPTSPSTSAAGSTALSSTTTTASPTTGPASNSESISAAPPSTTTKTSAAPRSHKLPSWVLFVCAICGVLAIPEASLADIVSWTPSPKVIRLEPLTTVPASQSAAIKNIPPPSWPLLLLLLFSATCVFAHSKSSLASVPTTTPLPTKPKAIPVSAPTSGSASTSSLPRLSMWLALPFFSFASFVLASVLEGSSHIDSAHAVAPADHAALRRSFSPKQLWVAPISLIGAILARGSRLGTRSLTTLGMLFMILHLLVQPTFAQLTSSPSMMTQAQTSLTASGYQYQGQGSWTGLVGVNKPGVGVVSWGGREESADGSSVGYSITTFSVSHEPNAKSTFSPRNMKEVVTMTHVSIHVATVAPTTINIVLTVTSSRPGAYSPASLPTTTSTPTGSNKPTLGPWTYYGCFTESTLAGYGPSFRALNASVTYNYTSMTLELCAPLCLKSTFFGIEYGGECYCGNAFNNGSMKVEDAECSTPCPGNGAEWCGAGNRLSVYVRSGSGTSVGFVAPVTSSTSSGATKMGSSTSASVSYEGVVSTLKTSPASKTGGGNGTITSASSVPSAGMKLDISFLLMALGLGIYVLAPYILEVGELLEDSNIKE